MIFRKNPWNSMEERQRQIQGALYEIPDYSGKVFEELPEIRNLGEMADRLLKTLIGKHVVIFGDYDADGVMAACIMAKGMRGLAKIAAEIRKTEPGSVEIRVPNRFEDGYGFQTKHAESIHDSVILLVDNGICACEAIRAARENGNTVYVVDHHEPGAELPEADLIVNPHAVEGGEFDGYCAGGLCYRLMRRMIERCVPYMAPEYRRQATETLKEFLFMGALATVADVVPMLYENRVIVKEGMKYIPPRWRALCGICLGAEKLSLDEEDIGFRIAPAINAAGRLGTLDSGFLESLCFSPDTVAAGQKLAACNIRRRQLTREGQEAAMQCIRGERILIAQSDSIHQGVAGIVAGHLAESFRKPVFVFGKVQDGACVGSGRAPEGTLHLKELLDRAAAESEGILLRHGGHQGAAGVTVAADRLEELTELLNRLGSYETADAEELRYDFDLGGEENWLELTAIVNSYAPFGEGNPAPLFRYRGRPAPEGIRLLNGGHVKFSAGSNEILGFGMADRIGPAGVWYDGVGRLRINRFRDRETAQLQLEALEVGEGKDGKNV